MVLPALIGAGATIAGAYLSSRNADKNADAQRSYQYDFAKNQIQWRVHDAAHAGIHPLAALGVSPISYQPQYVGGTDYGLTQAGQDISRAVRTTMSSEERKVDLEMKKEQLQSLKLENLRKANVVPPVPSPEPNNMGISGQDSAVKRVPSEVVVSGSQGVESGAKPFDQFFVQGDKIMPMPSQEASEPMDSSIYHQVKQLVGSSINHLKQLQAYQFPGGPGSQKARYQLSRMKNKIIDHLMRSNDLPKGSDIQYDPYSGDWRLVRHPKNVSLYYHRSALVGDYFKRRVK